MGYIKNVAIAFIISFCVIIIITQKNIRCEIIEVLKYRIGKTKIKIYDMFVILIGLIMILYSIIILNKLKIVNSLIERKSAVRNEQQNIDNIDNEIYENENIDNKINE